jgi:hypothetical protein
MPPDSPTLLLVAPQDDPLGLFADSVGGGRVPAYRQVGPGGIWVPGRAIAHNQPEALVLSLRGTVDEIGMGRAENVVRRHDLAIPTQWPRVADDVVNAFPRLLNAVVAAVSIAHRAPTYRLALVNPDGMELP